MRKKITKNDLYNLYVVEGLTIVKIAKLYGYKSHTTISNRLKEHNIPIRNIRECQFPIQLDINAITEMYNENHKSISEIASAFNCGDETIRRFMISNDIIRRDKTYKMAGWNVGLTKETDDRVMEYSIKISNTRLNGRDPSPKKYGKDWNAARKTRLELDEYMCQSCSSGDNLHVHHWTPYRFCYDNSLDNLITLCDMCHRDMHIFYNNEGFTIEMEKEYYEI
jgi:hypothetical protein